MRIAIIGRTEALYNTANLLLKKGYDIPIIITSKEAPEYNIKADDFEKLAKQNGSIFINTSKINEATVIQKIKEVMPIDIGVSMNYTGIVGNEVISLFRIGILNAHGGDLPRYRGNACQAWAIINGEKQIGLCIHKMIGGELDSGDIITRDYFTLNNNTKIGDVFDWMTKSIPSLFLESIDKLSIDSTYILEKQSKELSSILRTYPRLPIDGKIDWKKNNYEILRLINASSYPFSGAFCEYENEKMIIWEADLVSDGENYLAMPGQISSINTDNSVTVITGDGKIILKIISYKTYTGTPGIVINSIRKRLN